MNGGILIIEDTAEDLKMLSDILISSGYQQIITARDGETGIDRYREMKPDLVIIDLILSGMNGIEVLRNIRDEFPKAKAILCTSAGQGSIVDLAMRVGANGYVVKPYDPEILLSAVRRIMGCPA